MKRNLIAFLLMLISFGATSQKQEFPIDTSSVRMYLNMAKQAENGILPSNQEWDSLFNSKAYKALFESVRWNKKEFKNNVKNAFEIVYDPSKSDKYDSIVNELENLTNFQDELPFFVSTALNIRKNLDSYSKMLTTINMDSVVNVANSMALELVPDKGAGLSPNVAPIYFIVWDLECRALNDNLFLDLNTFFQEGLQYATDALAHEIHHFYLGPVFEANYSKDIIDGAVIALVNNMREGVADIINKKEMPLKSLVPYSESILKIYNEDYFNTPVVLEKLDKVTCQFLDNNITEENYFEKAIGCSHFEGHTTGDYMVFLIKEQLGIEAVIESVGNLDLFIDNYNKAALQAGSYVFSDKFTNHIHNLSNGAR